MNFHQLFHTPQQYWDFVYLFVRHDIDEVWRQEDRPKLKAFFDYSETSQYKNRKMTDEEVNSFRYYEECRKEYADKLFEIRDAVMHFNQFNILKNFGFDDFVDDDDDGTGFSFSKDKIPDFADWFKEKVSFPFILVGAIDSDFERGAASGGMFIDMVSLSEFNVSV